MIYGIEGPQSRTGLFRLSYFQLYILFPRFISIGRPSPFHDPFQDSPRSARRARKSGLFSCYHHISQNVNQVALFIGIRPICITVNMIGFTGQVLPYAKIVYLIIHSVALHSGSIMSVIGFFFS